MILCSKADLAVCVWPPRVAVGGEEEAEGGHVVRQAVAPGNNAVDARRARQLHLVTNDI